MQEKKELLICSTPYLKFATVYSDTDVTLKACILYFTEAGSFTDSGMISRPSTSRG